MTRRIMIVAVAALAALVPSQSFAVQRPHDRSCPPPARGMDSLHAAIFRATSRAAQASWDDRAWDDRAACLARAMEAHRRAHGIGPSKPGWPVDVNDLTPADWRGTTPHGRKDLSEIGDADRAQARHRRGDKDLSEITVADRADAPMRAGDKDLSQISDADRTG